MFDYFPLSSYHPTSYPIQLFLDQNQQLIRVNYVHVALYRFIHIKTVSETSIENQDLLQLLLGLTLDAIEPIVNLRLSK